MTELKLNMSEEKKISMQEYLEALKIVEMYHFQIMEQARQVNARTRWSISDLLLKEVGISGRLQGVLSDYTRAYGNTDLCNINKYSFSKIRNAGKKTWDEFIRAREEYLQKK
jgi:hypothetical protein